MTQGRLIAVVGPSGAGKDTVIDALMARAPALARVRRTITRPADAGGEDYRSITADAFRAEIDAGAFAVHWQAHDLYYGIPSDTMAQLHQGTDMLANFSRAALPEAARIFPRFEVLHITAPPEILAQRLAGRGRETAEDIARRLARKGNALPAGLIVHEIINDSTVDNAANAAFAALYPTSAKRSIS